MNNNTFAVESFISFCDDMIIVEEGFKDSVKKIGKSMWIGLLSLLSKLLEKLATFQHKIYVKKNKKMRIENNYYKKFLSAQHRIERGYDSFEHRDAWLYTVVQDVDNLRHYNFSKNKKDYTTIVNYGDIYKKIDTLYAKMKSMQKKIDEIAKSSDEYIKNGERYINVKVRDEDLKKYKEFQLECDKAMHLYNLYNELWNTCKSKLFSIWNKVDSAYYNSFSDELEEDDFDFVDEDQ